jgi:hypothetical protein
MGLSSSSSAYIATDSQLANYSWCRAPIWGPWPEFYYCRTFVVLRCGAPFLTRGRVCNLLTQFTISLVSKSRRTHLTLVWDSPSLEGQVPVFVSPRNRVTQLYPWALGSLFVTSYDSQGYSGGIPTHLHTGIQKVIKPNVVKYSACFHPEGRWTMIV